MKKNVYIAPEMEIVKLTYSANMLAASFNESTEIPSGGEAGDDDESDARHYNGGRDVWED